MERIWINKARSFEEAREFDTSYYLSSSGEERIETMQILRETYFEHKGLELDENGKRLRRILSVTQQT